MLERICTIHGREEENWETRALFLGTEVAAKTARWQVKGRGKGNRDVPHLPFTDTSQKDSLVSTSATAELGPPAQKVCRSLNHRDRVSVC